MAYTLEPKMVQEVGTASYVYAFVTHTLPGR